VVVLPGASDVPGITASTLLYEEQKSPLPYRVILPHQPRSWALHPLLIGGTLAISYTMELPMTTKLHFLSFSFPLPPREFQNDLEARPYLFDALYELVGEKWFDRLKSDVAWQPGENHRPFSSAIRRKDNTMSIQWNYKLSHAVFEISGSGCDMLGDDILDSGLMKLVADHAVRVDIATDFLTDLRPTRFVEQRFPGRFKSGGEKFSPTGHTMYVGSRDSNRFARVYRYYPPHPRAAYLRVEHELKHKDARLTCAALAESGIRHVQLALGKAFGWNHILWNPDKIQVEKMPAWRPERGNADTLRWLITSVVPALKRLESDGTLNIDAFVAEYLKN